jgi:hypothetical protein
MQDTITSPSVLRLIWRSALQLNRQILLSLPDRDLSQAITEQVKAQMVFSPEEAQKLDTYVISRLLLIRDIAIVN